MILKILLIAALLVYGNLSTLMTRRIEHTKTSITFLDIGTGDSTLLRASGKVVLVDGGPEDNIIYKLDQFLQIGEMIDILIITHFHNDHYSGIYEILDRFDVGELWVPYLCNPPDRIARKAMGTGKYREIGGQLLTLRLTDAAILSAISVNLNSECYRGSDPNQSSIVVTISKDSKKVILMGDAYVDDEIELIDLYPIQVKEADILKAGHHCSNTSSSKEFLLFVDPKLVICSTGKENRYGHPDAKVLNRMRELGINYLVTYEEGDITIDL